MAQPYDKAELIKALRDAYAQLRQPFSRDEFRRLGGISDSTITRAFGSWRAGIEAAGLSDKFAVFDRVAKEKAAFSPEKAEQEAWDRDQDAMMAAEEDRRNRWLRKTALRQELARKAIMETLATIEPIAVSIQPLRTPPPRKGPRAHITLWFEISDSQIGTMMTAEEMGGINEHNWVIWKDKLGIWREKAKAIILRYLAQGFVIDRVVFAMLGDMVEGEDIFPGQIWQIDRPVMQQVWYGANDMAAAIVGVAGAFPDIDFRVVEVLGNHGRMGKKGERPYIDSADWLFQRVCEMQVTRVDKVANLTWHQNEAWFGFIEVYGWHHLLLHGDQGITGLWSSKPTVNGLEKGVTRYNHMLQQQIHFVHAGHFHSEWALSFNMSYMLINGSFIGTSKFSASKMVSASPAMQSVHVFGPDEGLLATERIYLSNGPILKPVEPLRLKARR